MTRRLYISPEAESDIVLAARWYEEQRAGLGQEFLLGLEAALARVERTPESFASVGARTRRASLRRFPYGIFFVVEEAAVTVIAVMHAGRSPAAWKRRSKRK